MFLETIVAVLFASKRTEFSLMIIIRFPWPAGIKLLGYRLLKKVMSVIDSKHQLGPEDAKRIAPHAVAHSPTFIWFSLSAGQPP